MNLERFPQFSSQQVPPRNVDVWLPPEYADEPDMRYPVMYMHDGQNLFFAEESFVGVTWGIDQAVRKLIHNGEIRPPIVVGIWNTPNRLGEYMPEYAIPSESEQKTIEDQLHQDHTGKPYQLAGEAYLRFIVTELKPWVDSNYPTLPGRLHTNLLGSSMGGLFSLYALCRFPEVFGGAASLSTPWHIGKSSLLPFFETNLPDPANHRIYMDLGGKEVANPQQDQRLQALQSIFNQYAREAGYQENDNFLSLFFPNHQHNEQFWSSRVDIPIKFLLAS
jgi:predicted alpha/beta superfamily hydrolase